MVGWVGPGFLAGGSYDNNRLVAEIKYFGGADDGGEHDGV
jgi:hypothetical protein